MDEVFAGEHNSASVPSEEDLPPDPDMSASDAFIQQLTTQVNRSDVHAMVDAQLHMLVWYNHDLFRVNGTEHMSCYNEVASCKSVIYIHRDGNYRLSACPGQVKIEVDS